MDTPGTAANTFVRRELIPASEPPRAAAGTPLWVREHLFGSASSVILTVLSAALIVALIWPTVRFLLIDAVWSGSDREACVGVQARGGACWPFIAAKFNQFIYGFYPADQQWRV